MASEVGICNLALQKLGAESISSLTEDSRNARAVNACYAEMRDAEISAHPWSFARTRATLTASATTPDFEFTYQFTLPVGALRLQLPRQAGLDWELEGGAILTNDGTPLDDAPGRVEYAMPAKPKYENQSEGSARAAGRIAGAAPANTAPIDLDALDNTFGEF